MLSLTRKKLKNDGISLLDWLDLPCRCPECEAENAWRPGCASCGTRMLPKLLCRYCNEELADCLVEYTATGQGNAVLTDTFQAVRCPRCNHVYIPPSCPDKLDEFAAALPPGFRILPELGIRTDQFLEVSAYTDVGLGEPLTIRRHRSGIEMIFGPQSKLFQSALEYITDFDESDFGHDLCPTLRIRPAPPYSDEQRRVLHILLSQVRNALDTPLKFWTTHFGIVSPTDLRGTTSSLLALIERCPYDRDRKMLALANSICNEEHPGKFINTFRLLELLLDRLIDKDVQNTRWDSSVNDEEFSKIVRSHTVDLKTRLRRRVEALPHLPEKPLREIWRILQPTRGFSIVEVYAEIAKFRNLNVHKPFSSDDQLTLPWEAPNFELFTHQLLKLIVIMLEASID